MDIWRTFRSHFEVNDGSLPGVGVGGLTRDQLASTYQFIRSIGEASRRDGPACFWSESRQLELPIDSVPNAAALVSSGEAAAFHFMLSTPSFERTPLPELGVFVLDDAVILDYRMGEGWNSASVAAFLLLLRHMLDQAPGARIEFDIAFPHPAAFLRAWNRYLRNTKTTECAFDAATQASARPAKGLHGS